MLLVVRSESDRGREIHSRVELLDVTFTAYSVDRAGRLQIGMTIDRKRYTRVEPSVLQHHVDSWHPEGVTQHGETYLLRPTHATLLDPVIELACELVRRAELAHAPSRFESVFGCETAADAKTFRDEYGAPDARIFEVETDREPFRADKPWRSSQRSTSDGRHLRRPAMTAVGMPSATRYSSQRSERPSCAAITRSGSQASPAAAVRAAVLVSASHLMDAEAGEGCPARQTPLRRGAGGVSVVF
jgi:hypothetical protein